jgi:hypothetical protein
MLWIEFLVCFDYEITYIKGETNLVADALSQYYESDNWDEMHNTSQYVSADAQLDPEGEDLPWGRFEESCTMWDSDQTCPQYQCWAPWRADKPITFMPKYPVMEVVKDWQQEAADLAAHKESGTSSSANTQPPIDDQSDPMVGESLDHLLDLCP